MKIKDIAKVTNGKSDVKDADNDGKYLFFDRSTIVKRSNKFLFDSKSIIIPGEDSRMVFEPRYYEGKFNLHQRCYVIYDLNQKYSTKYLYYKLKTLTKHFANVFVGSTVPSLRLDHITDLDIEFPILDVQQKIASVFSALDSKIELNNRINAELEAMAKTLYDYWFVQFDFPDKNGKPYKTSGGKMVWNEELKREIPEGWDSVELKDIANITMGQSPPGESYNEEGDGMIFYQGCTDFGKRFPTVRKFTSEPTRFARKNDILLSVRAPVGTMNIAKEDCCIGRGLAALNSKENCMPYLFGVMTNLKQIFDRRNTNGTTFGAITKDDLFSIKVISPCSEVLKKFDKLISPLFYKQNTNEFQNIELIELRDWLLPMLMNGQVKVN